MKREFSAGGIVFNNQGQVLVTQHSSNKHWSFPKGHIEKGQSSKEAALREVKEEVGIEAEIIGKVGQSSYVFQNKGEKIFKDVGSSTGGFVDCLLQNGAKKVYAVDTAYGELAWKLRNDPKVVVMHFPIA